MTGGVFGVKRKLFTEQEISIIREHFDPVKSEQSCKYIHDNFIRDRTPKAIRGKASRMGLERHTLARKWEDEELDIIRKHGDKVPVLVLYSMLKKLWNKREWRHRGYPSVKRKLTAFGYSTEGNTTNYYTQIQLAQALGCGETKILNWTKDKDFNSVLKSQKTCGEHGFMLFHIRNIRRFMEQYPGEIAKCRPDILWLLSVAFEKEHW